jgi:hypothetical protein
MNKATPVNIKNKAFGLSNKLGIYSSLQKWSS